MSKSTDERGRIYLPKDVRERFGERFRIVELPTHVALFPVDEDPVEGVREAVGSALEGEDADDLRAVTRERVAEDIKAEREDQKPAEKE